MSKSEFKSANYITLRQFQGGWIWLKNINEISARIIPSLQSLSTEKLHDIANLMRGELLPWQIFDDTQWVLRFTPLPEFIILIVFNHDDEFGSALKIFYHKSSLKIPTEDAYVFTEIFLEILGQFAKHGVAQAALNQFYDELISFPALLEIIDPTNKEKMWNDIIGQREAPLLKIDRNTAKKISISLEAEFLSGKWYSNELEWGLKFNILNNLDLYTLLPLDRQNFQIYYTKNVLNFESRRILFFIWLYCNAIIREARNILGEVLPKLSDYL